MKPELTNVTKEFVHKRHILICPHCNGLYESVNLEEVCTVGRDDLPCPNCGIPHLVFIGAANTCETIVESLKED